MSESGSSISLNTGILINGLFLSSSVPKKGQKGLLIDDKIFIPMSKVYINDNESGGYYRCVSVDQENNTWTGYKAVLNDGVYIFEDVETPGLSYSYVTPQVGKVYNSTALISVSELYQGVLNDGLVFHASLSKNKPIAETGQILTTTGAVNFTESDGIPCAFFDGKSIIKSLDSNLPSGNSPRSISVWAKSTNLSMDSYVFGFGTRSRNQMFALNFCFEEVTIGCMNNNVDTSVKVIANEWHHYVITAEGNKTSLYVDGVLKETGNFPSQMQTVSKLAFIGASPDSGTEGINYEYNGYISSVRIYNKILSQTEISALYSEISNLLQNKVD